MSERLEGRQHELAQAFKEEIKAALREAFNDNLELLDKEARLELQARAVAVQLWPKIKLYYGMRQ